MSQLTYQCLLFWLFPLNSVTSNNDAYTAHTMYEIMQQGGTESWEKRVYPRFILRFYVSGHKKNVVIKIKYKQHIKLNTN